MTDTSIIDIQELGKEINSHLESIEDRIHFALTTGRLYKKDLEDFLLLYQNQLDHHKHLEEQKYEEEFCSLCSSFVKKQREDRKMCPTCYKRTVLYACNDCGKVLCDNCILYCDNRSNWDSYHGRGRCQGAICPSCQNDRKACVSCGNKGCDQCYEDNEILRACEICDYAAMGRLNDDKLYKKYHS